MKILVTGATGFIGSHLVERLVGDGHKVIAFVRDSDSKTYAEGLEALEKLGVEMFHGDILDSKSIETAARGKDVVFHLAAIARPMAIPDKEYFTVNEHGTRNVLDACLKCGTKKVIHMSSLSAVGPTRGDKPMDEKSPLMPVDVYGESKMAAEKVVHEYVMRGLDVIILRPSMVFGPRDRELLKLFKTINMGIFPIRNGKGYIEFLYVENLVDACLLAAKNGKKGEIYHINNGKSYHIQEISSCIADAEGKKLLPIRLPNFLLVFAGLAVEALSKIIGKYPLFCRSTVIWMTRSFWYTTSSKAAKELGYKPKYSIEDGVKKTVDYYRQTGAI